MLWQALTAVRDLGRLHDIASILIRYGFGDMVRRMGLANALERAGRALHWNEAEELAHLDPPARVRRALEELGPTFVKLGQVLATRIDLFEPEWIAEFGKLQDSAPAASYAGIRQQLTEDLGAPPEEVFATFDPEPLAAASIAQVHRARLEDGSEVVVKVRRPGIRPIIEADLRWLARLAKLAEGESLELRAFRRRKWCASLPSRCATNSISLANAATPSTSRKILPTMPTRTRPLSRPAGKWCKQRHPRRCPPSSSFPASIGSGLARGCACRYL